MDEDEVVDPQLDVTPDDDPMATTTGTDPDTGLTWKLEGDRYVWEDGKVTNADGQYIDNDGNVIPDEPETKPAAKFHTPDPVVTPAPAPQPTAQQPAPKWTSQLAYQHIYNDEALQAIADLSITDPLEAERRRSGLNAQYQNALAWINSQASSDFDTEMDQLQRGAPTAFELFGGQINRVRQRMRTDELQAPGAAKRVVSQAIQEAMGNSADSLEEFAQRLKGKVAETPKRRTIAKPDVIPPEDRIPGPGTARRVAPRAKSADREDDYVKFYRDYHRGNPRITEDEIKEMAANARRLDAERMRKAGAF